MRCTACGIELGISDFRMGRTIGDCHPLCSACAQSLGGARPVNRQALLRRLYAAGRDIASCNCCSSNRELEIHFIKPLAVGGTRESANLLVLCPECHDKVHQGATISGSTVSIVEKNRKR